MSEVPRPANRSLLSAAPIIGLLVVGVALALIAGPVSATATSATLSHANAALLGFVEGVTEFLPVSSTGHLLVTERLLRIGTAPGTRDAADAYAVIIQLGAIVAVVLLSWRRIADVFAGLVGKSATGKRLLINLIAAFAPAAIVGLLLDKVAENALLKPVWVAIAWIVGGIVMIALRGRYRDAQHAGRALDAMTTKHALIIGCAQALALWPGVSRSLVTILAAILLGFKLSEAVEFSFLLGLCTLGAAAAYSLLKDGTLVFDSYGSGAPLLGLVVAFISALIAVRWMVEFLKRNDLNVFAYYRIAIGALTLILLATSTITN